VAGFYAVYQSQKNPFQKFTPKVQYIPMDIEKEPSVFVRRKTTPKKPLQVSRAFSRIEKAVAPYPKAALFELAERGFKTPFQQLVACLISIRTFDEVSLHSALRLLKKAPTPEALAALSEEEVDTLISPATFHRQKAKTLHGLAISVLHNFAGRLPCDEKTLLSLKGVGPKCAHLVLGISCGKPFIAVDTHVHRVTNRWGYVQTSSPEKTMVQLERKLPEKHWIDINRLLVPFGKHICTWSRPKCSLCPVLEMCQQVGVVNPR
jgi:endonuclease-3